MAKRQVLHKLLDAWEPPEEAGTPIGCLATSFTFDASFFEEECLGRFLRMESDPNEKDSVYLLELDEKLAQLRFAAALVDINHCQGIRSLRWDLVPVRVRGGIQHAKIALLQWSNCIRLIIGSANLTPSGYRLNQEVFGVIDFQNDLPAEPTLISEAIAFINTVLESYTSAESHFTERAEGFLTHLQQALSDLAISPPKDVRMTTVFVQPKGAHVLNQLSTVWPANSPPISARVVSPFFDPDDDQADRPTQILWESLRKRGFSRVDFHVTAESIDSSGALFLHAPESLRRAEPEGRSQVDTRFFIIEPDDVHRPLHAKSLWLENDRWKLYCMGSSNFTSKGLGLGAPNRPNQVNLEANLAYLVDSNRHPKVARSLDNAFLTGIKLPRHTEIQWLPADDTGKDAPDDEHSVLPEGFLYALYRASDSGEAWIDFAFQDPPDQWTFYKEDDAQHIIYSSSAWLDGGAEEKVTIPWSFQKPPSGFWVTWQGDEGKAWLPVLVDSSASLPPPEELKDLPLELLINLLTSALPYYRNPALKRHFLKQADDDQRPKDMHDLDPHKRVDTSRFLLQKTRRIGFALSALRARLERPVYSEQSLVWRLRGPVGVLALGSAVLREANSDDERVFLLTELALEIGRVEPNTSPGSLTVNTVHQALDGIIQELRALANTYQGTGEGLQAYVNKAFEAIAR